MKRSGVYSLLTSGLACVLGLVPASEAWADRTLTLDDLADFTACLTGPEVEATPQCADDHDSDGDLDVDLADFAFFQAAFVGEPATITRTQLGGNSLSGYPFFEYVRAFNDDATVEVAIDPTLHPDIVGQTADLYIVAAKSEAGWILDPTLVDVRVGGPQAVALGGTTIQENTFLVASGGELDADAGIDLGVGYDAVLDCNLNGELDGGDYIDGGRKEAGFYVVKDTCSPGPLDVTEIIYSGGSWLGQDTYYPTNIGSMGQLPLVVVSHGNGHDYTWYDHIGYHLASYGCIVMSHQNDTGPGSEAASTTTLTNTEYIIANQDIIAGGVLDGHIDSGRITWIGHSRGGEGVVRAHVKLRTGVWSSPYYDIDDVVLVSSMAPVTHIEPASASTPWDVNYHMFIAGADDDVTGSADSSNSKPLAFYERAFGNKQLVYIHGAGHGDLHDGGGSSVAEGPDLIGRAATHTVVKGYYLPLVKLYAENSLVGREFFGRLYEHFHPPGIPGNVICANYYRDAEDDVGFVIDDYESQTGTGTSSSGGSVSFDVQNLDEVLMRDQDGSFAWTGSQPSNGMTMYRYSGDDPHCVVFDWNVGSQRYYEFEVVPAARDLSQYTFLSFRACQGTQHPRTDALDSPLSFSATLRDSAGVSSPIDFGSMGRITRTYERSGGWANEFGTVRLRLTDFLTNGSGLDLTDVVAVRFEFGSDFGSAQGRIGLDDVELANDYPPLFAPVSIAAAAPPPEFLPPGVPAEIDVVIDEGSDTLVPDSALLHYRYDGGAYQSLPLVQIAGELWRGTLPAPSCGDAPEFYFSVEGAVTGTVYAPTGGASAPFVAFVGTFVSILEDDFESDLGWTVENDPSLTSGAWERGLPADDGEEGDPLFDYDGSGRCYLTGNWLGNSDVDGGPTILISPVMDLDGLTNPVVAYARWWANDDQDDDPFKVEITNNANDPEPTWVPVETVINIEPGWVERAIYVTDYVGLSTDVQIRFSGEDVPNNSKDEGGLDAVRVFDVACP